MESSSPAESKRRRGGKLSTDPQSVAARRRRHRISERFKILQSLVPGAANMDTASLLEEAIRYVHFLKAQIWLHHNACFLASSSAGVDTEPDGDDGVVFTPPPPPLPPPWDPPCNAFRHPSAEEWAPAVEPPPLPGYSGGFRGGNVAAFDDLYYIDP